MDRRNGGDPLAPPRPPKLLPRIHRPRAPEPPMMSAPLTPIQQQKQQQQQRTNNHHLHSNTSINSSSSSSEISGNNNNNNSITNSSNSSNIINNNNINSNSSNSNSSNINNNINNQQQNNAITAQPAPITAPLIPLQLQQQHHLHNHHTSNHNHHTQVHSQQPHTFNVSNNSLSSTTITSTNSFTRRRLPPPIVNLPLLPSISSNLIHSSESPVSPVTLAAPRPESERLANEYVDTPFRTPQQLHQASRSQHPAGQTNHGQTTTHHNLLLVQQNQRQQQQQQQSHHHHPHTYRHNNNNNNSNEIISSHLAAPTATSVPSSNGGGGGGVGGGGGGGTGILGTGTPGIGTTTILHSNISSHKGSSNQTSAPAAQTTTTSSLLLPGQTTTTSIRQHHQQSNHRPTVLPITQAITKQPVGFSKETPTSILLEEVDLHHLNSSGNAGDSLNSIQCPQCRRCRCEQCQSPRQLPSRWVCNKTCLCSAETVIDYASCLCCVKALFYHCAKDHEMECDDGESISCADDPCSCLPHRRTTRWGWLAALSLALPCLWCYWPMRGCVAIFAKCYARHSRHGCRCQSIGSSSILSATMPTTGVLSNAKTTAGNVGADHHHLHHNSHHHQSGITGSGGGSNGGGGRTIIRTSDLTPEKRLLDSSPEY